MLDGDNNTVARSGRINLDTYIIDEAWRAVRTRSRFEGSNVDANDEALHDELFRLLEKLSELSKQEDPMPLLQNSNFSDSNKQHILRLWNAKAEEECIKWGIDVIVGNSHVRKSLHPKIWLILDGEEIEMNLEAFSKLRYQVSRALSRIDSYM